MTTGMSEYSAEKKRLSNFGKLSWKLNKTEWFFLTDFNCIFQRSSAVEIWGRRFRPVLKNNRHRSDEPIPVRKRTRRRICTVFTVQCRYLTRRHDDLQFCKTEIKKYQFFHQIFVLSFYAIHFLTVVDYRAEKYEHYRCYLRARWKIGKYRRVWSGKRNLCKKKLHLCIEVSSRFVERRLTVTFKELERSKILSTKIRRS